MFDYEWATVQHTVNCRLAAAVVVPEAIPPERLRRYGAGAQAAPLSGPQGGVLPRRLRARRGGARELGLDPARPIVVVRTPPSVSLYHRFENDLFADVLERLAARRRRRVRPAARPRSARSSQLGGFVVPERAIDAQSLIAYADLVVSAGGTMNREAVALGTPVYTTFEGRLGAVDERLIAEGRLRRLEDAGELEVVERAAAPATRRRVRRDPALLVDLLALAAHGCRAARRPRGARRPNPPYNPDDAPTDPLGGLPAAPPLAAAARGGRGAGRARVLPRLPAALRRGPDAPDATSSCSSDDLVGRARQRSSCSCCSRVYQRRWRYVGPARLRGGRARRSSSTRRAGRRASRCSSPVTRRRRPPATSRSAAERRDRAVLPAPLVFVGGARVRRAAVYERPLAGASARARKRAPRADRRRRRGRAAGAARDPAQPRARPAPGRLRRRRPAQARPAHRRRARARATPKATCRASSTRPSPTK